MELTFYSLLCFLMSLDHFMTAYRHYPALLSVLNVYRSTFLDFYLLHIQGGMLSSDVGSVIEPTSGRPSHPCIKIAKKDMWSFPLKTQPVTEDADRSTTAAVINMTGSGI